MRPELVPQAHGGALKRGGRHPGASAKRRRTSKDALEFLRQVLESAECRAAVEAILHDQHHKHFPVVYQDAMNRLHGKPKESVELSASVAAVIEHQPLTILLPQLNPPPALPVMPEPVPIPETVAIALPPDPGLAPDVNHDDEG